MIRASSDLITRVRAALSGQSGIVEKRMFGSIGFILRGHLLAGARRERVLFRISPAAQASALAQPGVTPMLMRGKPCAGYVHVTAAALADDEQLEAWLHHALTHNASLAAK